LCNDWKESSKSIHEKLINLVNFLDVVKTSIFKRADFVHHWSIVIRAKSKGVNRKAFARKVSWDTCFNWILSITILTIRKKENWTNRILCSSFLQHFERDFHSAINICASICLNRLDYFVYLLGVSFIILLERTKPSSIWVKCD